MKEQIKSKFPEVQFYDCYAGELYGEWGNYSISIMDGHHAVFRIGGTVLVNQYITEDTLPQFLDMILNYYMC